MQRIQCPREIVWLNGAPGAVWYPCIPSLIAPLCIAVPQTPKHCVPFRGLQQVSMDLQGKGANTPFILESRGLTRAETMSSLLERHSEIRDLMAQGELVPDTMVGSSLPEKRA